MKLLTEWPQRKEGIRTPQYSYKVRGREITGDNYKESLSKMQIPKIGMPAYRDWGELLSFLMRENLPGGYPDTKSQDTHVFKLDLKWGFDVGVLTNL